MVGVLDGETERLARRADELEKAVSDGEMAVVKRSTREDAERELLNSSLL